MTKQKTAWMFLGFMLAAGVAVTAAGCMTKSPVQNRAYFPADGSKYAILGRVSIQIDLHRKGGGYTELLEAAKELYPQADDVVNIFTDGQGKQGKPPRYLTISGIAIDYTEVP